MAKIYLILIIAFPSILGMLGYLLRKQNPEYLTFYSYFFLLSAITEIAAIYVMLRYHNNLYVYNAFNIIKFGFHMWWFHKFFRVGFSVRVFIAAVGIFLYGIVEFSIFRSANHFSTFRLLAQSATIYLAASWLLHHLLYLASNSIQDRQFYFFMVVLLFGFCISTFFMITLTALVVLTNEMKLALWQIFKFLLIFNYIMFIVAYIFPRIIKSRIPTLT
ncbi:MAG: hypothetical protein RL660_2349 [Bacteroidota bacterium]|jgi:hypothetical protein